MKDDTPERLRNASDRSAAKPGPLGRFLTHIDARAFLVTGVLVAGVLTLVALARAGLPGDWADRLQSGFAEARSSAWAFPAVIAAFTTLAFVGAPQFLMIGATVAVFGPVEGALYAWFATMSGASATFVVGRVAGARALRRFGGERLNGLSTWLGGRGIAASALIRMTPSAPFAVVNACAGASHIKVWKFFIGTGIGICPKIMTIAVLGAGVEGWAGGGGIMAAAFAAVAVAGWIVLVALGRGAVAQIPEKSI